MWRITVETEVECISGGKYLIYCVQAGYVVDDEINRLLVNPLPVGVRLHAIIDACHSGSALDLEYKVWLIDSMDLSSFSH